MDPRTAAEAYQEHRANIACLLDMIAYEMPEDGPSWGVANRVGHALGRLADAAGSLLGTDGEQVLDGLAAMSAETST